jgi:hypothetical protein
MRSSTTNSTRAAFIVAAVLGGLSTASAQSLLQTSGVIVAANDDAVPGVAGAIFGGSSTLDTGVLDESGNVFFRGRMTGGGAIATTDRGLFYGSDRNNLALVIRSGDAAPGLPGVFLQTATGTGPGSSPRLSPGGLMWWGSSLAGTGIATTNDSAIFVGTPGNFSVLVQEGDSAPGTLGATLSSSFSSPSWQPTGINRAGRVLFQSSLLGGDVVGSTNNSAWYTGTVGALELVQRKGDSLPGGVVVSALGFVSQMNESGQIVIDSSLSTTLGTSPATSADDKILGVFTPGSGYAQIWREGDAAPGTVGAVFTGSVNTGSNTFNRSGEIVMRCDLTNGDVIAGVNDSAIYVISAAATTLAVRRGDAAPGGGGEFIDAINNSSLSINQAGEIAFQATLTGPNVTTANDTAIFAGLPGALVMAMREGDACPGTVGATFDNTFGTSLLFNNQGQLLITSKTVGGDTTLFNSSVIYGWHASTGLTLVIRGDDLITITLGNDKNVSSFGGSQFNNGDNAPLTLGKDGTLTLKVSMTDGTNAIMIGKLPIPVGVASTYCTAKLNSLGCLPAMSFSGAQSAASTSGFTLSASNVRNQKSGLLFYGVNGRAASAFQGGTLCVNAPIKRTPGTSSAGSALPASDGTGVYSIDMNAFATGNLGGSPLPELTLPGSTVDCQFWGRDPGFGAPNNTTLSDAVEYLVAP